MHRPLFRTWINGRREGERTAGRARRPFSERQSDTVELAQVDPTVRRDRRGGPWRPWFRRHPVRDGRAVPRTRQEIGLRGVVAARAQPRDTHHAACFVDAPVPSRVDLLPHFQRLHEIRFRQRQPAARQAVLPKARQAGRDEHVAGAEGLRGPRQLVAAHRERFGKAPLLLDDGGQTAGGHDGRGVSVAQERARVAQGVLLDPLRLPRACRRRSARGPDPGARSASPVADRRAAAASSRRHRGPTSRPPAASEAASGSGPARPSSSRCPRDRRDGSRVPWRAPLATGARPAQARDRTGRRAAHGAAGW